MTLDENPIEQLRLENMLNFAIISTDVTLQVKLDDKDVFFVHQ